MEDEVAAHDDGERHMEYEASQRAIYIRKDQASAVGKRGIFTVSSIERLFTKEIDHGGSCGDRGYPLLLKDLWSLFCQKGIM